MSDVPSEFSWAAAKSSSPPIFAEPPSTILPLPRTNTENGVSLPPPKSRVRLPVLPLKVVSRVPLAFTRMTAKSSSEPMRAEPATIICPFCRPAIA